MVASENFTPLAVMAAQGSVLTNEYANVQPHSGVQANSAVMTWNPASCRPR